MVKNRDMLPRSLNGVFTYQRIKEMKREDIDKFYEYHKRIMVLKTYIERFPNRRIKYAQEIMLCQDEQKRMIREAKLKEMERTKK